MRNNSQDNDDNDVGGLLFYDALTQYEIPGLKKSMPNYGARLLIQVLSGICQPMSTLTLVF